MKQLSLGMESIAFQTDALFKGMVAIFDDLLANSNKEAEVSKYLARADKLAYDVTGVNVMSTYSTNPDHAVVFSPVLTKGNVLNSANFSKWVEKHFNADKMDFHNLSKKGWVDPKTSQVGGAFSEIIFRAYFGGNFLFKKRNTAEDIAVSFIHELGHAFNFLAFIADTVLVNAVLQRSWQEVTSGNVDKTMRIVFEKAATDLELKNKQWLETIDTVTDKEVGFRILVSAVQIEPRAMDNKRFYSEDACEELADIFVARHGGARALAVMRSKLKAVYPSSFGLLTAVGYGLAGFIVMPILAPAGAILCFSAGYLAKQAFNKAGSMPDITTFKQSATKMRNQLIEQIKQMKLEKDEVNAIVDNIETIDELIQNTNTTPADIPVLVRFLDMLRVGKMDARASRVYTDKLEALVANDLFIRAAQFSSKI